MKTPDPEFIVFNNAVHKRELLIQTWNLITETS